MIFAVLLTSVVALAQIPAPAAPASAKPEASDVIEGTRKESPIFVQLDPNAVDRSILIFQRKNFNDFHEQDRKRRLKFRADK